MSGDSQLNKTTYLLAGPFPWMGLAASLIVATALLGTSGGRHSKGRILISRKGKASASPRRRRIRACIGVLRGRQSIVIGERRYFLGPGYRRNEAVDPVINDELAVLVFVRMRDQAVGQVVEPVQNAGRRH